MSRAETDEYLYQDTSTSGSVSSSGVFAHPSQWVHDKAKAHAPNVARSSGPRRTPRKSLIVVLPDDHIVTSEAIARRMVPTSSDEEIDVIVACAGQPRNLETLQDKVRGLQGFMAPAGTSKEDLRELAIGRAPGDIVTLLSGVPIDA